MTTQTTPTPSAPVVPLANIARDAIPKAAKAFVLAETAEGSAIAKAHKTLAKALEKAGANKLDQLCEAALMLGDVHLSAAQFDAQVAEAVRKMLATAGIKDVPSALKRSKLVTLAMLCGDETLRPVGGEPMNAFLGRVSSLLESTKLPDGRDVWERKADGTISKRGATPLTEAEKAAKAAEKAETAKAAKVFTDALGSAGNVTEGGQRRSAELAAAIILFGDTGNARRAVTIAKSYRDEFGDWSRELLDEDTDADEKAALAAAQFAEAAAQRAKRNGATNGKAN